MQIINYATEHSHHFDQINRDWIEKYFVMEERDNSVLRNPEHKIINPGGAILFATEDGEILGTVALMKQSKEVIELTKMGVYEHARNKGIGKLLMKAAHQKAKNLGFKTLVLYSNKKLENAIHLYRNYGFIEVEIAEDYYDRCDIKMELSLEH
ncbi:MAG: GNAT family N-acetyltransferase [Cytophagales bacterium]|nr:GNAT family N-acetyltransferase [Cytophagales bacterium]